MEITSEEAKRIMRTHGLTPTDNDIINISDAKMLQYIGTGYLKKDNTDRD